MEYDKHILTSLENELPVFRAVAVPPSGCAPQLVPKEQELSIFTSFTQTSFVKALIQIHPTEFSDSEVPMNTLVLASDCPTHPLGCSWCFGGNWGAGSTPVTAWSSWNTKSWITLRLTSVPEVKPSQLFHFQLLWDSSDCSDFSLSVLFISFQCHLLTTIGRLIQKQGLEIICF